MTPTALGIDVGTSRTKVVLTAWGPEGGTDLATVAGRTPSDAVGLVDRAVELTREVLGRASVRPDAVGVTSMAETGVPLAADGAPLTALLGWDGRRAVAEARDLSEAHGYLELFRATGVRPSAKVPLATMEWLRRHEPAVAAQMAWWAGAADLVVLALTGELVTDHTLAGRTMAYRRPAPGEGLAETFDADLLALVGLRPATLPRVVDPSAVAGRSGWGGARPAGRPDDGPARRWRAAGQAFTAAGVPVGTPVVLAGHDHAVGTWASGVRLPGDRADSIGTTEAVLTVRGAHRPGTADGEDRIALAGMSLVRTVSGRHEAVLAGSSSAGAVLTWLADRGVGGAGAAWPEVSTDRSGPVVLPYLSGRQTPQPDPAARVRVLELGPGPGEPAVEVPVDGLGPAELAGAVLEGVCLQARWMVVEQGRLSDGAGPAPREPGVRGPAGDRSGVMSDPGRLVVLGGPALTVPGWADLKVATSPWPSRWVGAPEPVASGAALLALVRAGLLGPVDEALLTAPTLAAREVVGQAPTPDPRFDAFVAAAAHRGRSAAVGPRAQHRGRQPEEHRGQGGLDEG
ncbi:carbohydrate kinase [Actinotalea sp. BY-33]|uniref:Carbohydrate kinase n=1 Tax=Actinotalea soli TaxID=2819234 RepID=A0A939RWZ6_9CELL|nr:FGGY family carbohydrate kinase [Actinotalea soli]MBO1752666.1 carbohydrate kinase [Actinotalea soli]